MVRRVHRQGISNTPPALIPARARREFIQFDDSCPVGTRDPSKPVKSEETSTFVIPKVSKQVRGKGWWKSAAVGEEWTPSTVTRESLDVPLGTDADVHAF